MWSDLFIFLNFGIITLDGRIFPGLPDVERDCGGAVCWFGLTR